MLLGDGNGVPAHMRNLEAGIRGRDAFHRAGDPAQARGHGLFAAFAGEQLHADADAEERRAAGDDALFEHFDHAGHRIKPGLAIGEGANAGQHDAVGFANLFGIGGDQNLDATKAGGHALKGF
ncbi:hypothetical protein FQZ97_1151440 [compost metagenome]